MKSSFIVKCVTVLALTGAACERDERPSQSGNQPATSQAAATQPHGNALQSYRVIVGGPEYTELNAYFDSLRKAIAGGRGADILPFVDTHRLLEMLETAAPARFKGKNRDDLLRTVEQRLAAQIPFLTRSMRWTRHRLQHVLLSDRGNEAVVVLREWDSDGVSTCTRYWLTRRDGHWRFYDNEIPDLNLRMSTMISVAGATGADRQQLAEMQRAVVAMVRVSAIDVDDPADVKEAINQLESLARPALLPPLEVVRLFTLGSLYVGDDRAAEALELFDRAEALNSDMPMLEFARATAHFALGAHERAIEHADAVLARQGENGDVLELKGQALAALGRHAAAADCFRRALDDTPELFDSLVGLAHAGGDEAAAEVAVRFARMPRAAEQFDPLASELAESGRLAALQAVIPEFRKLAPGHPSADYFEALLAIRNGDFSSARKFLEPVLTRASAGERRAYVELFLDACADMDAPLDGYRHIVAVLPDSAADAFRYVAGQLDDRSDNRPRSALQAIELLNELIAAHAARAPDDLWLAFYRGRIAALQGEFDRAATHFAAGAARADDEEDREAFRAAHVTACYRAGDALRAYRTIPPPATTFEQLAQLASDDGRDNLLSTLIAARRADAPDDAAIEYWQAEVHWLRDEYSPLVQLLAERLKTLPPDAESRAHFEARLFRAYLRLRRFEEALGIARASTARDGDPYYEVAAYALLNQPAEAIRAFERCVGLEYSPQTLYDDADAGSALRGSAYSELHAKYPPEPDSGDDQN